MTIWLAVSLRFRFDLRYIYSQKSACHARVQKFRSDLGGSTLIFFGGGGGGGGVNEWRGIRIPHRSASETPLKWRFAGVPMMAQH